MNSARVLYGASAFTAITAGSRTRRAIGVRSRSVTLASVLTSGVCSHTPVKRPSVFGSPRFSARKAAATALLPPALLTTCMRTGSSFSFSTMIAIAGEHVAAASRAGVHDQLHGSRRPEPLRARGGRGEERGQCDETQTQFHGIPPYSCSSAFRRHLLR